MGVTVEGKDRDPLGTRTYKDGTSIPNLGIFTSTLPEDQEERLGTNFIPARRTLSGIRERYIVYVTAEVKEDGLWLADPKKIQDKTSSPEKQLFVSNLHLERRGLEGILRLDQIEHLVAIRHLPVIKVNYAQKLPPYPFKIG